MDFLNYNTKFDNNATSYSDTSNEVPVQHVTLITQAIKMILEGYNDGNLDACVNNVMKVLSQGTYFDVLVELDRDIDYRRYIHFGGKSTRADVEKALVTMFQHNNFIHEAGGGKADIDFNESDKDGEVEMSNSHDARDGFTHYCAMGHYLEYDC